MEKENVSLNDVSDLFRRRWPIVGLVFLTVVLVTFVIAFTLEDLYESRGVIMIEEPYGKAYVPNSGQGRNRELGIYRINDDVMNRQNLVEIVEKYDLYTEDRVDGVPQSVVWMLRENFALRMIREAAEPSSRDPGRVIGFSTSYFHPDRQVAKGVSRSIQVLFMEANDRRRRDFYAVNIQALEDEAAALEERLREADAAVVDFKLRNPGALPDNMRWNQQQVERKDSELTRIDSEIRTLETRKTMLASQLAQTPRYVTKIDIDGQPTDLSARLENLQAEYIRLRSLYNENHPDVVNVRREIDALTGAGSSFEMREALLKQLATERQIQSEMRLTHSPDHPDRRAVDRKVRSLEQQIAALPTDDARSEEPTNPAYISLTLQLNATNTELRAQRARRASTQAEIDDFETKLVVAPEVEREWLALSRELELVKAQSKDIETRLEDARTGERIGESKEVTEYWRVHTRPRLPVLPAFPNRPLYLILGAFIGLTLGIGAGLIAEAFDSTIRGTRDVRQVMQMPPIAAIPVIRTDSDRRRDRLRHVTVTAAVLVAVGVVGLYVRMQMTGSI